jgi:hypothetical protein
MDPRSVDSCLGMRPRNNAYRTMRGRRSSIGEGGASQKIKKVK